MTAKALKKKLTCFVLVAKDTGFIPQVRPVASMTKASRRKKRNTCKKNQNRDGELPIRRPRGLCDIPPEILLIVANQLAANSRTSLALACKGFFALICPDHKFLTMGKEDTVKLLLLLEKDAKRHYLCFGCLRLQPFDRNNKF